ncbi:sensor domain-containing protein [Mycobacterium colombiense]|uniref:Nuclease PIN n=1 Tax=Mycobacterium colombiense TaxID=339268 RepID=A0A1A2YI14_9MYCO|nr:sensor domain-containing protein [Mycobacterium colombiense]OBI37103.1 hypothetical protein A5708_07360 [Mycobacterium colombiense]
MTIPPQNPFEHNPFGSTPFGGNPAGPPVYAAPPAPPPDRPPVNALATLSVVFAFMFAPVGAILGHLGLRQIRRTGQRGRDRALVGTVLSYAVIVVVVGVSVVWLTRPDSPAVRSAAPTTAPPPAAPAVTPSDLARLVPTLADTKAITGDDKLIQAVILRRPEDLAAGGQTTDRPECRGTLYAGVPDLYNVGTLVNYYMPVFADRDDPVNTRSIDAAIAAFPDPAAAQAQLTKMSSAWHQCGGLPVKITFLNKSTVAFSLNEPIDSGNGITTIEASARDDLSVHAIAAKANVVIDLLVSYTGNDVDRARQTASAVANQILNKIPG